MKKRVGILAVIFGFLILLALSFLAGFNYSKHEAEKDSVLREIAIFSLVENQPDLYKKSFHAMVESERFSEFVSHNFSKEESQEIWKEVESLQKDR